MNLEGTAREFWPGVSRGLHLRGSFARGLVLGPGRVPQLVVGTAGAPGAFLSLPVLFLHVAASGSWTSSMVETGRTCLALKVTHSCISSTVSIDMVTKSCSCVGELHRPHLLMGGVSQN